MRTSMVRGLYLCRALSSAEDLEVLHTTFSQSPHLHAQLPAGDKLLNISHSLPCNSLVTEQNPVTFCFANVARNTRNL